MKTPIKLLFDNNPVATIISFGYETPWATGKVEFLDQAFFSKLISVTAMLFFIYKLEELNLTDKEEEQLYEAETLKLGIASNDSELTKDKRWSIVPDHGIQQEIYAVRFYESNFMDWRM
jgi:hypothetical protein